MKMMRLWLLAIALLPLVANAQQKQVREGNKLYEQKKFKEAAAAYQQGLQKNPTYVPGAFNLGNAFYQQKNFEGTRKALDAAAKASKDKAVKADAAYNIGNTYMSEQKWDEAINSYKQTLRNNPADEAAKYNLSYALAMKKKEQGGGGGGKDNKDQKDQQDKNQQQNKDQKDKGDEKQDQQNQPKDNKDQQEQQKPQPQPSKLSEEQADQLLDALAQEEKKLHDKKEKGKATQAKLDKDW